jgi:hypothetical protein
LYGREHQEPRCAIAAFLTYIETATIQRPILPLPIWKTICEPIKPAASNQLWPEPRFIGLHRIFFPPGAQGWLLRGEAS